MFFGKKAEVQADFEIFVTYDSKVKAYGDPVYAANHEDLIRGILNMFKDPMEQRRNKLFVNAEDFSIFRIGTFSRKTGEITPCPLQHVVNCHDLRAAVPVSDLTVSTHLDKDKEVQGAL